jgi:hypothetical protein
VDEITAVVDDIKSESAAEGGVPAEGQTPDNPWWHEAIPTEPGDLLQRHLTRAEQARVRAEYYASAGAAPEAEDRHPTVTWDVQGAGSPTLADRLRGAAEHRTLISRVAIGVLSVSLVASAAIGMSSSHHAHVVQSRLTTTSAQLYETSVQLAAVTANWQHAEANFKTATTNYATDEAQIAALTQQLAALEAQLPSPRFGAPAP